LGVLNKDLAGPPDTEQPAVWTIGHSIRSREQFQRLLLGHEIRNLVDVRSFPVSRRYPHFNQTELAADLPVIGITYHHLKSLGGRRKPLPQSKNTAWQNASFRAYADYMDSDEFKKGIADLLALAQQQRTAIMCAEAVWWRCHRGLIADYLKVKGAEVIHIIDAARVEPHPFTAAARIIDGELSYQGLLPG
jgi:uncharacterized protein (DUF488 family)